VKEKIDIIELLDKGNAVQFTPIGSSMCPLFAPNRDMAIVEPVGDRKLKRGDIVLYRRVQGPLVLHRLYKVKNNQYYMVGDNQREIEGPLAREQIKGVMVAMVRKGKHFTTHNIWYRMASALWLWLRPVRYLIQGPAVRLFRLFRK